MLRVRLTEADLRAVRLTPGPAPLVDLITIFMTASRPGPDPVAAVWRHIVLRRVQVTRLAMLAGLTASGWRPGFVSPAATADVAELIETVVTTPREVIRAQFRAVADAGHPVTGPARQLAAADRDDLELRHRLGRELRYLAACLEPVVRGLRPAADRRHAQARRMLADGGIGALLNSLGPGIRYFPPYLELDQPDRRGTQPSGGAGLVVLPVVTPEPLLALDGPQQPVALGYPIRLSPLQLLAADAGPSPGARLAATALLGRTRVDVLEAIAESPDAGTGRLARLLGVAPASVSEHATVLRRAGLIDSVRSSKGVAHRITDLGWRVLHGVTEDGDRPFGYADPAR